MSSPQDATLTILQQIEDSIAAFLASKSTTGAANDFSGQGSTTAGSYSLYDPFAVSASHQKSLTEVSAAYQALRA